MSARSQPLLVTGRRIGPLRTGRCWFPRSADEVYPLLRRYDVLTVAQCPPEVADELARWAFSDRPDLTCVVDLQRTDEDLLASLHKSCRYELRRAQKDAGIAVAVNDRADEARALLDEAIGRKRWRGAIDDAEWARQTANADVFLASIDGLPAVAHVVLRGGGRRAQLQLSASAEAADREQRARLAGANRVLHWFELQHYRGEGFEQYDFGGIVLDPEHRMYGIAQFKLSFGGEIVVDRFLRLASNPLLRKLLARLHRGDERNPSMNAALAYIEKGR